MTPAIQLKGIGKQFDDTWAVRKLDLEVPQGSIYAFLGPNGAGKTTTLRLIAALLFPNEGTLTVLGLDPLKHWIPVREILSYVPDVPFLYGKLTGEEFLTFVGGLHRLEGAELRGRIDRYVDLFSLAPYHHQRIESYSHGTRQKYVVSAAMLPQPRVLLVDEPMVGLDPKSGRILKDLFREKADQGMSILLSTHTLSVAQELADHLGVIHRGELILSGTRSELLSTASSESLEQLFLRITN